MANEWTNTLLMARLKRICALCIRVHSKDRCDLDPDLGECGLCALCILFLISWNAFLMFWFWFLDVL